MRYLLVVVSFAAFALTGCDYSCSEKSTKRYKPTSADEPFYCTQLQNSFRGGDAQALITGIVGGHFYSSPKSWDTPGALPDYLPGTITLGDLTACEKKRWAYNEDNETDFSDLFDPDGGCSFESSFSLFFQPVETARAELFQNSNMLEYSLYIWTEPPASDIECHIEVDRAFPQNGAPALVRCYDNKLITQYSYSFAWQAPLNISQ